MNMIVQKLGVIQLLCGQDEGGRARRGPKKCRFLSKLRVKNVHAERGGGLAKNDKIMSM